jgi:hypothetical protein
VGGRVSHPYILRYWIICSYISSNIHHIETFWNKIIKLNYMYVICVCVRVYFVRQSAFKKFYISIWSPCEPTRFRLKFRCET